LLKLFNVVWEEKHSVNVSAKDEADAIEKVSIGDYDTDNESGELSSPPEAYRMKIIK